MAKLPPPNLPPGAMPWAREVEKRLGEADTKASRAYTNVGAFGQVIADVNNRNVTQTIEIQDHETKLAENAEAVAQAEAEIAALNAPDGPLATMEADLEELNGPGGVIEGIHTDLDNLNSDIHDPSTGLVKQLNDTDAVLDQAVIDLGNKLDNVPNVITNTLISDDAISSPKIQANAIGAREVAAYSISAEKLLIGNGDNILTNSNFDASGQGWVPSPANVSFDTTNGPNGEGSALIAGDTVQQGIYLGASNAEKYASPVTPGRQYLVSVRFRGGATVPATAVRIYVRAYTNAGAWTFADNGTGAINNVETSANVWGTVSGTVTIPNGYNRLVIGIFVQGNIFSGAIRFAAPRATLKSGATLIENGAITTDKVAANAITGDKVLANSITSSKLLVGDFNNLIADVVHKTGTTYPHIAGGQSTSFTVLPGSPDASGVNPGQHLYSTVSAGTNQYLVDWAGTDGTIYLPVKPNTKYNVSALIRLGTGQPSGDHGWVVREFNADKINLIFRGFGDYKTATTNWDTHSETLLTGPETNYVALYSRSRSATGIRFANPSLRQMSGRTLIEDGAITTDKMVANTINGDRIAANTLHANKIIAATITSREILAHSITANEITTDYLTGIKISAGEITGTTITGGTINGTTINSVDYTGSGMILRGAGEPEYMQLAGDSLWFYIDGRAGPLGAVDGSLGTAGTADAGNGIVTVGAYSSSGLLNGFDVGRNITFRDGVSRITDLSAGVVSLHTADVTSKLDFNNGYGNYLKVTGNLVTDSRIYQAGSYMPQAQAAGIVGWTGSALGPGSGTDLYVAFPTARFTQAPVVTGVNATSPIIVSTKGVTTSGVTFRLYNPHSASVTPGDIHWTAVQMTPTSASG